MARSDLLGCVLQDPTPSIALVSVVQRLLDAGVAIEVLQHDLTYALIPPRF